MKNRGIIRHRFLYISFTLILIFSGLSGKDRSGIEVKILKCDYKENPIGVGQNPHFSWILSSDLRNQYQSAYRLLVSDDPALLEKNVGNLWDSDKVVSDQSLHITYQGKPLHPGEEYYWKVKVWNRDGTASNWSENGYFVTSLFEPLDWSNAKWIQHEQMDDSLVLVPGVHPWGKKVDHLALRKPVIPLFRKSFQADKKVESAYLFISGLGHYKAYINGKKVSEDFLSPGWTDYRYLTLYNAYDVSHQVISGENAIGVIVGTGFYNVHNERYRKLLITYGMPKMICKLKITFTDGTETTIVSGKDWKTTDSPYTFSTIYGGETYNARLEKEGWNKADFDDEDWKPALEGNGPEGNLEMEITYPITANEVFKPKEISKIDSVSYLYDFGQNASGIVSLKIVGKRGQKVTLIPGELISEGKSIKQGATGKPHYYEYILKGDGVEEWQPQFSFYGFRYVEVKGAEPVGMNQHPDKPVMLELNMLLTYNSAPKTGEFSCSNDLFNRINHLILYAIQSNFQSVLTDCPHREKLGWLEQTHLMGQSIHFNYNLYHIYKKQVKDMIHAQWDNGLIPSIAPEYVHFGGDFTDSPEWGSAGVILPWLIYKWYGDKSVMEEAWPMMRKYLDYLSSKAEGHIVSHGLGDWYDLGPERPGYSQLTPKALTATAIYYYNSNLMAEMAQLLDKTEEVDRLKELAADIKDAFNQKFYDPKGKIYVTASQTAMAMPLSLGLAPESDRKQIMQNLTDSINNNGKALTAGDIGFHYLVDALTEGGASQLFYEMNNRDDVPGYGYQLKKGATALTESWQALPDVSNNHLMLGHIMEWFYKGLGGIRQAGNSVAYKDIIIKPSLVGDLTQVNSSYESPYGLISSDWKKTGKTIELNVNVPVNTKARIYLPAEKQEQVMLGSSKLNNTKDILEIEKEDGQIVITVGSGRYRFLIKDRGV